MKLKDLFEQQTSREREERKTKNLHARVKKQEEDAAQNIKDHPGLINLVNLVEMFDTPAPHNVWIGTKTRLEYIFEVDTHIFGVFLEHKPNQVKRAFGFSHLGGAPAVQIAVGQWDSNIRGWRSDIMNNVGSKAIQVFSIVQDAIVKQISTDGIFVFAAKQSKEDGKLLAFTKRKELYNHLASKLAQKYSLNHHPYVIQHSSGDIVYILSNYDLTKEITALQQYKVL